MSLLPPDSKQSTENVSSTVSNKRPRPTVETDQPTRSSSETLGLMDMSLESTVKLRLEAIFHPKFENEKSNQEIRKEMTQLVERKQGYLEVTLKHSGSLVMWSGGQRYYSKNDLSNQFTFVAEILLRQHFERAWRNSGEGDAVYEQCGQFLEDARLTCAFEVVTSVLGDHGDIPNRDFLILTAVAERATERFYSTSQVLEFAQRFRLPHNDAWAFTTTASVQTLFDLYDHSRETGLATDIVAALSRAAQAHVASMYPHSVFQGDILEGFIIRYIGYPQQEGMGASTVEDQLRCLATRAQEILKQVPPSSPPSFDIHTCSSDLYNTNIRTVFEENGDRQRGLEVADTFSKILEKILSTSDGGRRRSVERILGQRAKDLQAIANELKLENDKEDRETKRLAELLQSLSNLNKAVKCNMFQEILPGNAPRTLCVIHVLHDQTFIRFQQEKDKTAMNLFRGFVIELGTDKESTKNDVNTPTCNYGGETGAPFLMLKMKFLPYMVRTFICRNQLNIIGQDGPDAFVRASDKLLQRWTISRQGRARWMPFIRQWALYARAKLSQSTDDDLPPLSSFWYLKHLEKFRQLYESGHVVPSEPEATNSIRGTVCVIAPSINTAELAAKAITKALGCSNAISLSEAVDRWMTQGMICFGTVDSLPKKDKLFLREISDSLVIIMCGCSSDEIAVELNGATPEAMKACMGKCRTWAKIPCRSKLDMPRALIPVHGHPCPSEFHQVIQKIKEAGVSVLSVEDTSHSRPGVLVYFPGIPGCGKSSLVQSMKEELTEQLIKSCQDGDAPKVHILVGDEIGKSFWRKVLSDRQKDTSSLSIADKNTPPSSWSAVAGACSTTRAFPLAVLPDASCLKTTRILGSRKPDGSLDIQKSHFYPFSLEYLAICLARVLQREPSSHIGKLDRDTPNAAMIVVMFYSFYRYNSAEELQQSMDTKLRNGDALGSLEPVRIPFLRDEALDFPSEVKETLTEALQLQLGYDNSNKKTNISDSMVMEMEKKLRECIARFQDALLSRAAGLLESRQSFKEQIVDRILSLNSSGYKETIANSNAERQIKLVSIDVPKPAVHRIIHEHASRDNLPHFTLNSESGDSFWEADQYAGELFVQNTHVTMLYWTTTTQEAIRQKFGHLLGATIELYARALLWDDDVAALEVSVADTTLDGKKLPACKNEFSHVTVWVAKDAQAWMSNRLPNQYKEGLAKMVEFDVPVPLCGSVSFWDFENKSLPLE